MSDGGIRILGAGGHAKVAAEAWRSGGGTVTAFHDDDPARAGEDLLGAAVEGRIALATGSADALHVAIGSNAARRSIAAGIADDRCPAVIHAAAVVSPTARIGAGTLVCAGAIVQAEARIGRHVIVNTAAVVEHDVVLGDFVHVAPGARLAGGVRVGAGTLVGIGAVVLPGIAIGAGATVGAGAVVIRDVPDGARVVGNPARSR